MITKNENGFGWGSLLISILFFIASWIAFSSPTETLVTLGLMYGVIAIVQGFIGMMVYSELRRLFNRNPLPVLVVSILELFVGVYLIMNPAVSLTFFPILFATWFLADSVRNIILAFRLRTMNKKWFWLHLALGIIGVFIGIFLVSNLFVGILSIASLISVYFFVVAIVRLIDAFV